MDCTSLLKDDLSIECNAARSNCAVIQIGDHEFELTYDQIEHLFERSMNGSGRQIIQDTVLDELNREVHHLEEVNDRLDDKVTKLEDKNEELISKLDNINNISERE